MSLAGTQGLPLGHSYPGLTTDSDPLDSPSLGIQGNRALKGSGWPQAGDSCWQREQQILMERKGGTRQEQERQGHLLEA